MLGSPTFPFNEVMDGSFLGVSLRFEDLFDFIAALMYEFW